VVYKASSLLDRQPPSNCLASAESGGTGVADCNVYQRAVALSPSRSQFGYDATTNPSATADQNWPASSRRSGYSAGTDLLGVYVSTDYSGVTGIIRRHNWTSNAVLQLESRGV
jgi:hypothetical protein